MTIAILTPIECRPLRVCIAGSRGFSDYNLLKAKMDALLRFKHPHVCIVSGTANGADKLGERYAAERGYEIEQHPADWDKHGKAAGPIRNTEMAECIDACVVFWNGKSRGTQHMIGACKRLGVDLRVIKNVDSIRSQS